MQGRKKKWEKHGLVVKKLQNRQYRIKLLGSGRIILRNRRFIKQFSTVQLQKSNLNLEASTGNTLPKENGRGGTLPQFPQDGNMIQRKEPVKRLPKALRNLQPYNKPGLLE